MHSSIHFAVTLWRSLRKKFPAIPRQSPPVSLWKKTLTLPASLQCLSTFFSIPCPGNAHLLALFCLKFACPLSPTRPTHCYKVVIFPFSHLAPFQTIPRSRYDTDRSQREFYGQESLLNNFITSHCRDYSSSNTAPINGPNGNQHNPNLQQLSVNNASLKRNQCAVCSRVFANPASLKQHMRLHLGEKPFKCRYCDKTSATMCNILTHERIHTHERPYKCLVCAADFSSSSNLKVNYFR